MDLPLVDGLTSTQPDTSPHMAKLAEQMSEFRGNSQDALSSGICALEKAYECEDNDKVRSNIEHALDLLRHGPEGGDSDNHGDQNID